MGHANGPLPSPPHRHARQRGVVGSLPLLPVAVPDVVCVLLVKRLARALGAELLAPERQRLLQWQTDAFEEQPELPPALVLRGREASARQ